MKTSPTLTDLRADRGGGMGEDVSSSVGSFLSRRPIHLCSMTVRNPPSKIFFRFS